LKVICTGFLLKVATDPILHLVRFILVIYWLAIIMPAPLLILKNGITPLKAVTVSYKAGSETRWQHFFLLLFLFLINLLALIPAGLGLFFTLPLSYRMIYHYYNKMADYKLFDQ